MISCSAQPADARTKAKVTSDCIAENHLDFAVNLYVCWFSVHSCEAAPVQAISVTKQRVWTTSNKIEARCEEDGDGHRGEALDILVSHLLRGNCRRKIPRSLGGCLEGTSRMQCLKSQANSQVTNR